MTLRWRLNLSVLALMAVFLAAAALTVRAVRQNAEQTRLYLRMRELSQFTADVRTSLFQHLARSQHPPSEPAGEEPWPGFALDDIDIQIRHSTDANERQLWGRVRGELERLSEVPPGSEQVPVHVRSAEQALRALRDFYDLSQYRAMVETAHGSFLAQAAIGLACMLTVLLFLIYLLIVRHWLIQPIQVLKDSAETIGQGRLDHRVPLKGSDELSQLARSIDAMADGLSQYQADLVRTRELSALGELSANVAHGLRNPLAAIRSTAQLAERRAQDEEQRRAFRDLSAQADRMDQRITTLFQFSRPIELRCRRTSVAELAAAAQAHALPLLKARHIELRIEDHTAGELFHLDCEQMATAVGELLTNAAYHSDEGAIVELHASTEKTMADTILRLSVRDQGRGMSPATLQKAFDLFFTSRPEGTGVGLPLVRRIVERHEGVISISSRPGEGTRVDLAIPEQRDSADRAGSGLPSDRTNEMPPCPS